MNLLRIAAFSLISLPLSAQVPGYMGKRLFTGIDLHTSPYIQYALGNADLAASPRIPINLRPGIHVSYVRSRVSQVSGIVHYFRTPHQYTYIDNSGWSTSFYDVYYSLRSVTAGAQYTRFVGKEIAPVGKYLRMGAGVCFTSYFDNQNSPLLNIDGTKAKLSKNLFASFGLGKQVVPMSGYLLDVGAEVNFNGSVVRTIALLDDNGLDENMQRRWHAMNRIGLAFLTNLYIRGSGFLD